MKQCVLNNVADQFIDEYTSIKDDSSSFEAHGIFHSELLMVLVLVRELGIEKIIESGRARGQSTEVITRIAKSHNIEFHSIEWKKNENAKIAEERLKPLSNFVTLHYGDSFKVIPELIDEKPTLVIIDGPKGLLAQKLGLILLKYQSVQAVLLHDSARDKIGFRDRLEKYLGHLLLTSDDYEYVEKFRFLDDECWEVSSKANNKGVVKGPYRRGKKRLRSYGPTLSCILNQEIDPGVLMEYLAEVNREIKNENNSTQLHRFVSKVKKTIKSW